MPIPAVASTATTKAFQTTSPISTHSGTTYLTVSPHITFTWVFVFNKNLTSQFKDKDSDLVKDFFSKNEKQIFHLVLMVRMKLSLNIRKYIVKIFVLYNILNQIYSTTTTTTTSINL